MSDPMKQYEVTLLVDPVLSGEEIKATAQTYVDHLKNEGCEIVHVDDMGLRQLAYPINRRTSGVYYCIEFQITEGTVISKLELALRRDERIMRFLTVKLDKHGVKYNDDKRKGLIGRKRDKDKEDKGDEKKGGSNSNRDKGGGGKRQRKTLNNPTVGRGSEAPAKTVEKPPVAEEAAKMEEKEVANRRRVSIIF